MNSILNPEAPEFFPHFTSVTQDGYTKVHKTIRSSNSLPSGASHQLFKTFTDFNVVTSQLSVNVVSQSNQILVNEIPAVKLRSKDIEYNTDKIVDANDCMLDRVNINIDSVNGVNKPSDKFLEGMKMPLVSSWNAGPVIAKIQVGTATFIGAKNIPRPQIMFKDNVDNSESLWVPKISDKPNNVKPLALNILYNDEGEAVGYEHPYKVELDVYHPPSQFIDPDPSPPPFPPPLEETPLTHVATEAALDALVEHLTKVDELAVDVEHHSYRTYQGITCLIQITTNEGGDFIIDALAIREHIHKLNLIFTDPKKIKVFHGAESDVVWLQRDFGVYLVGLFDTHQAAKVLKLAGLSLKFLLLHYCRVNADKKYQLADWRMRPLPEELVQYARSDTHYLLFVWRRMKAELLAIASGQPHLLLSVFEQSRQLCGATYNKEVLHEGSHLPLYVRSNKSFNSQQMAALKLLYKWRDMQARMLDESTTYLLPNHMLLALAEALPREVQGVNACCLPMPPFVKQNLITIHRMLLSCRELPMEPQLYQMPVSIRRMVGGHHTLQYSVHDLSHFPEYSEDSITSVEQKTQFLELSNFQPDVEAFTPPQKDIVSTLNVDAQQFIPPYDRYKQYRSLAQMEEIKEYREKEARIAAIGKGNELIKSEVLSKLQNAQTLVNEERESALDTDAQNDTDSDKKLRKRKMSADKVEMKPPPKADEADKKEADTSGSHKSHTKKASHNVNPYVYRNPNCKKFYEQVDRDHKQPKMKFKKHKK